MKYKYISLYKNKKNNMESSQPKKEGKYKDIIVSMDEENKKCVDCNNENPTKISVNNGVLICESCSEQHLKLGSSISYIRDLDDEFDEYLLNYLTLGSNSKFKRFLQDEHIDESFPIEKKYLTKACDYYRRILKQKVKGEPLFEKNYENPNEILENPENFFPEFENYQLKFVSDEKKNKTKVQQAKNALTHFGAGLFGLGKKAVSGIKQGANFVAVKAQPATKQIKKGAGVTAKYVGKGAGVAGKFIKKEAQVAGKVAGSAYTNLKNNIVKLNKKNKNIPGQPGDVNNINNEGEEGEQQQGEGEQVQGEQGPSIEEGNQNNNINMQEDEPKANEENNDSPVTGELSNKPLDQ